MRTKALHIKEEVNSFITDFKLLVKFRLTLLVVFSAVMAALIATTAAIDWQAVLILAIGGFCITGAANILNEVLEKDFDKLMKRTANRPLATGRMTVSTAVMMAGLMSVTGIILLAFFNPWAAFLGTLSLLSYAFIYTPLKRVSPIAVTVGAIPGALPMMIGCVAIQGEITWLAFALFSIQFFWQLPHFWSIAWLGREDYTKAGFKLLPEEPSEDSNETGRQSFLTAMFLLPISVGLYFIGDFHIASIILVGLMSLIYTVLSYQFYRRDDRTSARKVMFTSFFYLPFVLIVLFLG